MKTWHVIAGLAGVYLIVKGGMKLAENFTVRELSGTTTGLLNKPGPSETENLQRLASTILQPIRDRWGRIKVTSGYRSYEVNSAVGGAANSQHLNGEAADIVPLDADITQVFNWIKGSSLKYGQVIFEVRGGARWIHISLPRPYKRNFEALLSINGVVSNA